MKIILVGSVKERVKAAIEIFKVVLSVPLFRRLFICKNWITLKISAFTKFYVTLRTYVQIKQNRELRRS